MSRSTPTYLLLFLCSSFVPASGHGMLIHPTGRNAVDRYLPLFAGGKWPEGTDGCNCADPNGGCPASKSPRASGGGQACLWFSQGCTIGCPFCTSLHGHTNKSLCSNPAKPTLNDPKLRTMNIHAEAGSADDVYMYNPWRAPGSAPVTDPCGMAGGSPHHVVPDAAVFHETQFAQQGDLGSKVLKASSNHTVWTVGSTVEVAWGIRYNHGGGYSYRLCSADEELTEACFQRLPLNFTGMPSLRWNNGTELQYKGTYVTEGTRPAGSMWARNPIPRIDDSPQDSGEPASDTSCRDGAIGAGCRAFSPVCEEGSPPWHKIEPTSRASDVEGFCSGDWTGGMLVDHVVIPAWIKPGKYVLGWRWDCEETAQVWQNCADVSIIAVDSAFV